MTTLVELNIDGYILHLCVDYDYTPAERGSRERETGLQLEPDYLAEIDLRECLVAGTMMDILPLLKAEDKRLYGLDLGKYALVPQIKECIMQDVNQLQERC